MKINKFIGIYLALLGCFTAACNKSFLDLNDPTKKNADQFYQDQSQVEQAVNGVYGQLQEITNSQYIFSEMPSDNTTIQLDPSDRGQVDRVEAYEFWNVTATNVNIATYYDQAYNTLYNINLVLAKIEDTAIDEVRKRQYRGELKFLRAYHYFNLVQYFGDVVLVTEPLENSYDAFQTSRSPQTVVYNQVVADLEEAVTMLPEKKQYSTENLGRASKGAALSLLGKVFLTLKDYTKAQAVLEQVLTQGYSLLASYEEVFDPANKNSMESIFEVQYQGGNNLGEWSNFIYMFAPRGSEGAITGFPTSRPQGWNIPTKSLINDYEEGDKRKAVSLKEGYTNATGEFVAIPFINKYNHAHTIVGRTDDNWPILRYADVMLMLAEVINEQNGPNDAYPYINSVRRRAGLPELTGLDQIAFRSALRHERRIELAFENDRWFDLKRSLSTNELVTLLNEHGKQERADPTVDRGGVPFSASDYSFEGYEVLFPIPDRQLFLSPNLSQNTGY